MFCFHVSLESCVSLRTAVCFAAGIGHRSLSTSLLPVTQPLPIPGCIWFELPEELVMLLATCNLHFVHKLKTPHTTNAKVQRPQGAKRGSQLEGHECRVMLRNISVFFRREQLHLVTPCILLCRQIAAWLDVMVCGQWSFPNYPALEAKAKFFQMQLWWCKCKVLFGGSSSPFFY